MTANNEETLQPDDLVHLGTIDLTEGKRLKYALAEHRKIELQLVSNPETCQSGGCGAKVEIYAKVRDVEAFREYVQSERAAILEGLEVPEHTNSVYDDQATEAICPACGEKFATSATECPECGLGFAVHE